MHKGLEGEYRMIPVPTWVNIGVLIGAVSALTVYWIIEYIFIEDQCLKK